MPGIGCNALNGVQVVVGCDMHNQIPPPPPVGPVPAPHLVVWGMGLAFPSTSKKSKKKVSVGYGLALGRQHDLGIGPYHAAINALIALVWAGASNKAEFGSSTVQIDTGRMAVALIPLLGINLQLDCGDAPCALPTSVCVATLNPVKVGFTLSDAMGGFAAMGFDIALTFIVSKGVGMAVDKGFFAMMGPLAKSFEAVFAARLRHPSIEYSIMKGLGILVGWAVSSPLGYSVETRWNKWGLLNDSVNDSLSPSPAKPKP
jgi:hypothetical protein